VVGVISREISVFFMARIRQHSFQPFQGHATEVVLFLMYTIIMQMKELHELRRRVHGVRVSIFLPVTL
jgi:hypothetical protein